MKYKFLILLLGIFLFSFASAEAFKIDEELDIKVVCLNDGYCSSAAFCNINVIDPDSILIVIGQNMTNQTSFFNYTIIPNKTGVYNVAGFCNDVNISEEIDIALTITPTGTILSTGQAFLYFLFAIGALLLFSFCLFWVFALPSSNNITPAGEIVSINDWKFLRLFLIPICYVLLWWEFGIMRSIFANFLILDGPHLFFNWGFWIMASLAFPLTILGIWLFFLTVINDRRIIKSLKTGTPFLNDKGR